MVLVVTTGLVRPGGRARCRISDKAPAFRARPLRRAAARARPGTVRGAGEQRATESDDRAGEWFG